MLSFLESELTQCGNAMLIDVFETIWFESIPQSGRLGVSRTVISISLLLLSLLYFEESKAKGLVILIAVNIQ